MAVNVRSSANRNRGYVFKAKAWDSVFYAHFKTRAKVRKYSADGHRLKVVNYFNEDIIGIRIIWTIYSPAKKSKEALTLR